jgi:hypothetical protein
MCRGRQVLRWPTGSALLWNAKGTSKRNLDSLSDGCFHCGHELVGEGFDQSGDGWVGIGHWCSRVF